MSDISDKLFVAYMRKGISYAMLSKLSNVPRATIQRYVMGETDRIDIDKLQAICRVLEVDVAEVLNWKKQKEEEDEKLTQEIASLIKQMPDDRRNQAVDYLRFLLSQSEKK